MASRRGGPRRATLYQFDQMCKTTWHAYVDTYRPPFTESKGRIRSVLSDIIWAGRSAAEDRAGREALDELIETQATEQANRREPTP